MINEQEQLFPYCIVWTMLPCISWFFPWVGHTGICSSEGVVYDFLGYRVNSRYMAFGHPLKYVKLEPPRRKYYIVGQSGETQYNQALQETNAIFAQQAHHLLTNNCHHHVAQVLSRIKYQGKPEWSQFDVWWLCLWHSSYIKSWYILKVYIPFLLVVAFIVFVFTVLKHHGE